MVEWRSHLAGHDAAPVFGIRCVVVSPLAMAGDDYLLGEHADRVWLSFLHRAPEKPYLLGSSHAAAAPGDRFIHGLVAFCPDHDGIRVCRLWLSVDGQWPL